MLVGYPGPRRVRRRSVTAGLGRRLGWVSTDTRPGARAGLGSSPRASSRAPREHEAARGAEPTAEPRAQDPPSPGPCPEGTPAQR